MHAVNLKEITNSRQDIENSREGKFDTSNLHPFLSRFLCFEQANSGLDGRGGDVSDSGRLTLSWSLFSLFDAKFQGCSLGVSLRWSVGTLAHVTRMHHFEQSLQHFSPSIPSNVCRFRALNGLGNNSSDIEGKKCEEYIRYIMHDMLP